MQPSRAVGSGALGGDGTFPAPRHPAYLRQQRTDDARELLPLARIHVDRRYGRSALGDARAGDRLLVVTYPHQDDVVFEALRLAFLEVGVLEVERLDLGELGVEIVDYSAADGHREISDRLPPMMEDGVEFLPAAAELAAFLGRRADITGVLAAEGGRRHWRRAAGQRLRNNWVFSRYEDLISRAHAFPDQLWEAIDRRVVEMLADAEAVRITSPEGTHLEWEVTPTQAELWLQGAGHAGRILGSTIQGIRFSQSFEVFEREAAVIYPTINGVVGGTSNDTGFFPHVEVVVEGGMVREVRGGGQYGELWRDAIERTGHARYPGYPEAGWSFLNDCSIGTNPKAYRRLDGLWSYNDSWTNMLERARAGVVQIGFGAEHGDDRFLSYAREHRLPTMHIPHIHNLFATFEVRRRSCHRWEPVIEHGHLVALEDPRILRIADALRSRDMLGYDWVPAVPGINHPGDYEGAYAGDPAAWIGRDQRGEFV